MLSRRVLALLPFLALAACGTSIDDASRDVASNTDDLVSDDMCATIDYGPRGPAADVYDFFATTDDAAAFMHKVEASGHLKGPDGSNPTFKGISTDPRILKLVADAYEGMRRVFPRETADLPLTAPPVAIVETPVRNAFVISAGEFGPKAPWIFVLYTGALTTDDDAVMGVIAHELGHLILRNSERGVRPLINATYLTDEHGENGIFGAKQKNDPVLAQRVADVQARERRVGKFPELGYGEFGGALSFYLGDMVPAEDAATGAQTTACANVELASTALNQAQLPFFLSTYEDPQPLHPDATQLVNLQALSTAVVNELHTCLATVEDPRTIRELYVANGFSETFLDTYLLAAEKDADANASFIGLGERLLAAEATVRAEVVALRADPAAPYARIRTYDAEEDSDDAAVRVMRAMGRDPRANGRWLLESLQPEAKAACLAAIAADKPIDFGEMRDVHPSLCWRYYHQVQLAKSLDRTCAPVPTRTRKPSGGNAKVTPVDPREFTTPPR